MTSPLYKTYETDPSLEKDGIFFDVGVTNSKGQPVLIKIRRAGGANQQFAKVFEQKTKPVRRLLDAGGLDPATSERYMREVYAESVVIGWEGMEDRDGNPLEFNKENVLQVFTDLPGLFRDLVKYSTEDSAFRTHVREEEAKN